MTKQWIAFFSQTGSEILKVSELLGRAPDMIITNQPITSGKINPKLIELYEDRIITLQSKPTVEDYKNVLSKGCIVTLHGWLRIIPPVICKSFTIYNSHPGLITPVSEGGYGEILRGKDPQVRAFKLGLKTSGCVIHKVIPEVDEGEIIESSTVDISNMDQNGVITRLHDASIYLWFKFLFDLFSKR